MDTRIQKEKEKTQIGIPGVVRKKRGEPNDR
jgi:hypothetical protein